MDQSLLLVLALASPVAVGARIDLRPAWRRTAAGASPAESPFAVSTEGMKICPKCGMGNLWTERTCIACGGELKG